MMNLDEAIKHAEDVAEQNYDLAEHVYHTDEGVYMKEETKCRECAQEHEQLAEWLKELKELRKQKRPHGEWKVDNKIYCSECGESICDFIPNPTDAVGLILSNNFCPNCGADMREGDPDDRRRD